MRVQAVEEGFYSGRFRNAGDVFDLNSPSDLSDSTMSIVPVGNANYPLKGWMLVVSSTAPLTDYSLTMQGASSPVTATVGVNSGGQKVYGQATTGLGAGYVV